LFQTSKDRDGKARHESPASSKSAKAHRKLSPTQLPRPTQLSIAASFNDDASKPDASKGLPFHFAYFEQGCQILKPKIQVWVNSGGPRKGKFWYN
jgi:hypothetical protein